MLVVAGKRVDPGRVGEEVSQSVEMGGGNGGAESGGLGEESDAFKVKFRWNRVITEKLLHRN